MAQLACNNTTVTQANTRFTISLVILILLSRWAPAQTSSPRGATVDSPPINFDIVSIKENQSDTQKMRYSNPAAGDSISYLNYPLFYVIIFANDFHRSDLVFGLPQWTKDVRYDIVGKVAPADVEAYHALTTKQRQAMFQKLLIDKFKLRFHLEAKELPALELMVAREGPRMRSADPKAPLALQKKYGQPILLIAPGNIEAEGVTMPDFASFLSAVNLGEQFVDKTGLTGKYDFTLKYAPETGMSNSGPEGDVVANLSEGTSLSVALKEQLGIQLKSGKSLLDCFVVDHIERPAVN